MENQTQVSKEVIMLGGYAVVVTVVLVALLIKLPKIKKKCFREGYKAGTRALENIERKMKEIKRDKDRSKESRKQAVEKYKRIFEEFEARFNDVQARKKAVKKSDLSDTEKNRRYAQLDSEFESWVRSTGLA